MKILVTGGASGLGYAITDRLCEDKNNHVFFTFFHSKENALSLEKKYPNASSIHVDFNNIESLNVLLEKIKGIDLDILINNALTGFTKNYFHKLNGEIYSNSFSQNVVPTLLITKEAILLFRKKKFGKIITILTAGLINTPPIGWSEYTANKAYLHSMAKSWSTENVSFNITSNCISPALMKTNLTDTTMDERLIEMAIESHPLKKLLSTEEVADAVNYLTTASQQINGINLIINASSNVI